VVDEFDPLTRPELPPIRKPSATWECRTCHYKPLDKDTEFCVVCGRKWDGSPGRVPDDPPFRPQVRADAESEV
jgi:hypothetical protein